MRSETVFILKTLTSLEFFDMSASETGRLERTASSNKEK